MAHEPLIVLAQFDGDKYDAEKIHEMLRSGKLDGLVSSDDFYELVPDEYDYVDNYESDEKRVGKMNEIYKGFIEESFRDGTKLLKAIGDGSDRIFTASIDDIAERTMKENVERAAEALRGGKLTTTLYNDIFNPKWSPAVAVCCIDEDERYANGMFGGDPYTTTRRSFLLDEVSSGALYCVVDAFDTHW